MNNIIIRQAKAEDAEQYVNLGNFVWRIAYKHIFPEEVFVVQEERAENKIREFESYHINEVRMTYVAEDCGKIVGFICGGLISNYPYFAERGYADLEALYIHPDYQGLGIASQFKKIFNCWLKEKGATKFVIGVLKDNAKARMVYEKWGGKLDSHTQSFVKLGVGYDEVFYTCDLEKE